MSIILAHKIAEDLALHRFAGTINISENGEALLNRDAAGIVGDIRSVLPHCRMTLFTNMALMNDTTARDLLDAEITRITVCIDGASEETYRYMKGLDLGQVRESMHMFIRMRHERRSNCTIVIYVISAYNYHTKVLGSKPPYPDDTREVIEYWSQFLSDKDLVAQSPVFGFWAAPPQRKPENHLRCMHMDQISSKLLISANGTAYLCCLDENSQLALGHVQDHSIEEIWNGKARLRLLRNVLLRNYRGIGEPCLHCTPDAR